MINRQSKSNPRKTDSARRRGTILILVVGVLVLLMIIGTAYVQVARWDRLSTALPEHDGIDSVVSATLSLVKQTLADDLIDEDNNFFNLLILRMRKHSNK